MYVFLRGEIYIKRLKKVKWQTVIIVALLLVGFVAYSSVILETFTDKIKSISEKEALTTLESVSAQNVELVNSRFIDEINSLRILASKIENIDQNTSYISEVVEHLKDYKDVLGFYTLGLTNRDGICYTTLDEELDLSKYDYIHEGFSGKESFTESYLSEDGKLNLNILAVPVYYENHIEYVLTASYKSSTFSDILNIPSFDGAGKSLVLDENGNIISKSIVKQEDYNIFDKKEQYSDEFNTIIKDMQSNYIGDITYIYNDQRFMAYYEPLNFENYYLVTYVPHNYVFSNVDFMLELLTETISYIRVFDFAILLLLVGAYLYFTRCLNKSFYYDGVTKHNNYNYLKHICTNMKNMNNKALLVIDVDNFKIINTRFGEHVGNKVLYEISRVFHDTLEKDQIFRDKNDIFVAILSYKTKEDIISKIDKFKQQLDVLIDQKIIPHIHISMGISLCENYITIDSAFNDALIAKGTIKGKYNKYYSFTSIKDRLSLEESKEIEARFQNAIYHNEFKVWYQPKYDSRNHSIIGAEALVRWQKSDGELVAPYKFIPVYERNGQIIELDMEVMRLTCQNICRLKKAGIKTVPISINLSRYQVKNPLFEKQITEIINNYHIESQDIIFEITETALTYNKEQVDKLIEIIQSKGFEVHMDDFGTGASGLQSLSGFNFNAIKIDKSFIDMIGNKKINLIIQSIISLCHNLHLDVIAEGVEKLDQVHFLQEQQCYKIQGYYFSKPICEEEFNQTLDHQE